MNTQSSRWWNRILWMKRSIVAFLITFALGLLSMGGLGGAICFLVSPVLAPTYGDFDSWRGDWVWPAMIGTGMAWSFGFLWAGVINGKLEKIRVGQGIRRVTYVAVLWAWALMVWWVVLWGR